MKKEYEFLYNEINEEDKVILACSGGADSICLLSLLVKLKKEKKLTIICAHVNHKKRIESEEEEKFVREYCDKNDVIFELLTINKYTDNFQNSARMQRYQFLKELQNKYKSHSILTAHHGDDLVETILMRITRGSNLSGYAGFKSIDYKADYKIIKPLITSDKKSILEYNKNNNIEYREDHSNTKEEYTRNRYRKYILPFLKEENKSIHLKYLKFSQKIKECDEFIKKYVDNLGVINDEKIDIILYLKEDKFIQEKIVELYILSIQEKYEFNVTDNTFFEINKLIKSINGKGSIDLSNGFKGFKEKKQFFIKK